MFQKNINESLNNSLNFKKGTEISWKKNSLKKNNDKVLI